jgi:hypothetical protein
MHRVIVAILPKKFNGTSTTPVFRPFKTPNVFPCTNSMMLYPDTDTGAKLLCDTIIRAPERGVVNQPAGQKELKFLASFNNHEEACTMLCGKGRVRTHDLGYQAECFMTTALHARWQKELQTTLKLWIKRKLSRNIVFDQNILSNPS